MPGRGHRQRLEHRPDRRPRHHQHGHRAGQRLGGQVTARNTAYNATIAPGAPVGIGHQATHTGNTAKPAAYSLNGQPCATG
nr:cellulose binding domain-containing protein [Saccharothrix syringae]